MMQNCGCGSSGYWIENAVGEDKTPKIWHDLGMMIAVDPGTRSAGVAISRAGRIETQSIKIKEGPALARLRELTLGVERLFDSLGPGPADVLVEDGIFRCHSRSLSLLSEARGVILAACFRRGWPVRKIGVQTWKAQLDSRERKMPKVERYVEYFNAKYGLHCQSAD